MTGHGGAGRPPILAPLYVPGDRPDRFGKAMASRADAVILDLEDAVVAAHKGAARLAVADYLPQPHPKPVFVRLNGLDTPWFTDDVKAIAGMGGLRGIRVPKVESAEGVRSVARALVAAGAPDLELHCLVESARGVEAAADIAVAAPAVAGIALGEADLASELNVADEAGLAWPRGRVVVAARAAGLPPPLMSVYPRLGDEAGLAASCALGRRLGFVGRTLIHPAQAPVVLQAFAPSTVEVDAARQVLDQLARAEELGNGTAVLADGRFVDRAMAEGARRTLAVDAAVSALPAE